MNEEVYEIWYIRQMAFEKRCGQNIYYRNMISYLRQETTHLLVRPGDIIYEIYVFKILLLNANPSSDVWSNGSQEMGWHHEARCSVLGKPGKLPI